MSTWPGEGGEERRGGMGGEERGRERIRGGRKRGGWAGVGRGWEDGWRGEAREAEGEG